MKREFRLGFRMRDNRNSLVRFLKGWPYYMMTQRCTAYLIKKSNKLEMKLPDYIIIHTYNYREHFC